MVLISRTVDCYKDCGISRLAGSARDLMVSISTMKSGRYFRTVILNSPNACSTPIFTGNVVLIFFSGQETKHAVAVVVVVRLRFATNTCPGLVVGLDFELCEMNRKR